MKTIKQLQAEAQAYRELRGLHRGVVVFFHGKLQNWAADLTEPFLHIPGSIALALDGTRYRATGGGVKTGAERWEEIVDRPTFTEHQSILMAKALLACKDADEAVEQLNEERAGGGEEPEPSRLKTLEKLIEKRRARARELREQSLAFILVDASRLHGLAQTGH